MMRYQRHHSGSDRLMIVLSFVLAMIVDLIPLSEHYTWLRPQWALLVVLYWHFYSKRSLDVQSCWAVGLIFDLCNGALIGHCAAAMVLLRYLSAFFGNRLKLYAGGGQLLVLLCLVALSQIPLYIFYRFLGQPQTFYSYGASVLSSLLLWPVVYKMLVSYEKSLLAF